MSNNKRSDQIIEVHGVDKTYLVAGRPFAALSGVDLAVLPGELLAIVGKSGSGKSTLLNLLAGLDLPSAGEIWVCGTPVHTLGESARAVWRGRHVGVVFQFFQLLPTLTVVENVMLPIDFAGTLAPTQARVRALGLLERFGIARHAHKLPSALSGGEQQRAALARALANDPPIIVADEPTGNLDSQTANAVIGLFAELVGEGKTVLVATHDRDLVRRVDRAVTRADGRRVAEVPATAPEVVGLGDGARPGVAGSMRGAS